MSEDDILPQMSVRWSWRLRLWRRHRRLHKLLKSGLVAHGVHGDEMRCVHCGRAWRLVDLGVSTYLIDLPRR